MEKKLQAGIAVMGVASVLLVGSLILNEKPPPGTCEMSAAGAALVADSLNTRGSAAIMAGTAIGGVAASEACKYFLEQLDKNPDKKQPVQIKTNNGVVQDQLARRDFTQPPPPPPAATPGTASWDQFVRCTRAYDVAFLRELCWDGKITPEAATARY